MTEELHDNTNDILSDTQEPKSVTTEIIYAAANEKTDDVQLQIDLGLKKEVITRQGWTALHLAAASGYKEIVSLQLDRELH